MFCKRRVDLRPRAVGAPSIDYFGSDFCRCADGKGKVTSGKATVNDAGLVCSYTFNGTYDVNPDGTNTTAVTSKADSSNSPKCAPGAPFHTSGVGNNNTVVSVSTNSDSTLSFFCVKTTGQ